MLIDFYYWTEFLLCVCQRAVQRERQADRQKKRLKCRQSGSHRENDSTVTAYGRSNCFFTHPISPSVDVGDLRLGRQPYWQENHITGISSPVNHTEIYPPHKYVESLTTWARLWNVAHTSEWAQHTAAFTGPQRQQPLADNWVGWETLISTKELLAGGTY